MTPFPLSSALAGPTRILVVEDDPLIARLVSRWLDQEGLRCDVAGRIGEATVLSHRNRYGLVLADLHMPDGSGLELARTLKASDPSCQVIMMTGDPTLDRAVEALRVHVDDYLVKPFDSGSVVRAVRRALEHRRLILENLEHRRSLEDRVREQSRRIERLFLSSIRSLVTALEAKDPYTRGHSDRVTAFALALHDVVGGCDPESLRLGAQLHDIGKIGVQSAILLKDGPLTPVEHEHLRKHPMVGVRILTPLLEDRETLGVVRHHHERWDGAGYPDGLRGDTIPRAARIVALADAYDAMTTIRPYRPARSPVEAVIEIEAESGRQFDPELAAAVGAAFLEPSTMAS